MTIQDVWNSSTVAVWVICFVLQKTERFLVLFQSMEKPSKAGVRKFLACPTTLCWEDGGRCDGRPNSISTLAIPAQ